MKQVDIGAISIVSVPELPPVPAPATGLFANVTPELVARGREWLDPRFIHPTEDLLYFGFHSFVIRTGSRTILVDTCHGNHKIRRAPFEYANKLDVDYLGNLARAGLQPEEIDIVLCTHLHVDHVGWNTRLENGRWVPTFPNARYLFSKREYEHFEREHRMPGSMEAEAFVDSVVPIVETGRADLIDTSHLIERELGHAVWIEGTPGHTPGQVALHAGSKERKAVFCGDVMHHPLQVMEPSLYLLADWDVALAQSTRRKLLEDCADKDTLIMTAHFPDPTSGRVVSRGDGFRFQFAE